MFACPPRTQLQRSRDLIAAERRQSAFGRSSTNLVLQRSRDLIAAERLFPTYRFYEPSRLQRSRDLIAAERPTL